MRKDVASYLQGLELVVKGAAKARLDINFYQVSGVSLLFMVQG